MLARAKINLHLHITGRAESGYHHLDSLVAFTSLHDDIQIKSAPEFQLNISGNAGCSVGDNLVTRVTHLLAEQQNILPNVQINLTKNIPLAGGLGGGSADAAATLRLLQKIWNVTSTETIEKIAMTLGSDILACLHNKPVIMRGTGNIILSAPQIPEIYGLLVNPNVPCPTQDAYKTYAQSQKPFSENIDFPTEFLSIVKLTDFLNQYTRNDMTDAAIKVAPEIKDVLNALENLPDCLLSRLSGSGATCFALFPSEETAQQSYLQLMKDHPQWCVKPTIVNSETT